VAAVDHDSSHTSHQQAHNDLQAAVMQASCNMLRRILMC
jgi:hypothetical protein